MTITLTFNLPMILGVAWALTAAFMVLIAFMALDQRDLGIAIGAGGAALLAGTTSYLLLSGVA